ncbi:MAG: hypothetical protein LBB21_02420 [Holosporaceae bacterium]|jgi:hypothetical protein|nr:hypothetical protein [Holosporaceae bacterium]
MKNILLFFVFVLLNNCAFVEAMVDQRDSSMYGVKTKSIVPRIWEGIFPQVLNPYLFGRHQLRCSDVWNVLTERLKGIGYEENSSRLLSYVNNLAHHLVKTEEVAGEQKKIFVLSPCRDTQVGYWNNGTFVEEETLYAIFKYSSDTLQTVLQREFNEINRQFIAELKNGWDENANKDEIDSLMEKHKNECNAALGTEHFYDLLEKHDAEYTALRKKQNDCFNEHMRKRGELNQTCCSLVEAIGRASDEIYIRVALDTLFKEGILKYGENAEIFVPLREVGKTAKGTNASHWVFLHIVKDKENNLSCVIYDPTILYPSFLYGYDAALVLKQALIGSTRYNLDAANIKVVNVGHQGVNFVDCGYYTIAYILGFASGHCEIVNLPTADISFNGFPKGK